MLVHEGYIKSSLEGNRVMLQCLDLFLTTAKISFSSGIIATFFPSQPLIPYN